MSTPFREAIKGAPIPQNAQRAGSVMAELGPQLDPALHPLLEGMAGCSPYLARLATLEIHFLVESQSRPAEETLAEILNGVQSTVIECDTQEALMKTLRILKRRAALFIALCDLGGVWPLDTTLKALSDFADASIEATATWLLNDFVARDQLPLDKNDPVGSSGLAILGLGKLGAHELNYSSDVDLIFFFDPERFPADEYARVKQRFNQLTRQFVKILSDQTSDGYVHRVDLRLRPDPGSTAACMSMDSAERYYESFGQNWERSAFIKARAVGGDIAAGDAFLKGMVPFVWRKYLDFATIEDVRNMKSLIHKHKGHGEIAVAGHNVKLGRGGIREIEFFAQTQQLIAGGREPELRERKTLDTLAALLKFGWITGKTRAELAESYEFLRMLEHRLQMIDDAQTHTMPTDAEGLLCVANFCGLADVATLEGVLRDHLTRVSGHFERLFNDDAMEEGAPALSAQTDAQITDMLAAKGYRDPERAAALLGVWRGASLAATKTPRAQAKLDRLVPRIIEATASALDPDGALAEFDRFLHGLPAGVQILSLFEANPNLLDLITEICAAAPRLAHYLGRNAQVIDAMLAQDFFQPLPDAEALLAELSAALPQTDDFEEVLNASRRWSKERHFRIGAQLLRGIATPEEAARAYTALADACIRALTPHVTLHMAKRHGAPPGGGACVLAMGRLGAREMTASSDLDLLVIYDDTDAPSDGPSPLAPQHYFARWTQRLVAALTAQTAEGALYEVDMRLRPSGRSGPLATRLEAFRKYQAESAWTWEHMSLTRGRIVCGPPDLLGRTRAAINQVLAMPRERAVTLESASEMRQRLIEAKPDAYTQPLNVKLARGGMLDMDFVLQTRLLLAGCGSLETVTAQTAMAALSQASLLTDAERETLTAAHHLQTAVLQFSRLALDVPLSHETASPALGAAIARALDMPDFRAVESKLAEVQAAVQVIFDAQFQAA
jgi:glutamate-ammonia-ligase adenylyltransferase